MGAKTGEALSLLARTFESQGATLEAIKCHVALTSGGKQLPATEVKSQVALARLLMAHTQSTQEARQRLERAQVLVTRMPKALVSKCQVASELARCQGLLGEERLQRQTLQRALSLYKQCKSPEERAGVAPWHAKLLSQLAAAAMAGGDASAALAHMDKAVEVSRSTSTDQLATALLGRAQLAASSGNAAAAEAALAEAASVLEGIPAESAQHLRTHHWLLATMLQLWMGETLALQQAGEDGQNRLIAQLEAHLEGLRGSQQGTWLHRQALCALACLVTACALRPGVELKQAVSVVERGLAHVYKGLDAEGVDLKAGEASVARSATRGVRALLLLHCLLSECGVLIHLAMTDHDSAQGRILLMQGVFTRFPTLLADALYTIQMTTGHYLHSLERFPEAAAAYEAAAAACTPACAPSGAHRAAELYRGLALLGTGASADLEAACGLLHQRTGADAADSASQVTLVLRELLGSAVAGRQGEPLQRKHLLSKALKRAHNSLGNHQLVSQARRDHPACVLNALAPCQQEQGDLSGAEAMLRSSVILAKHQQDLTSQVHALAAIVSVKQAAKEDPAKIGEAEAYHAKKTTQLQQLRGAALASDAHQQLSAWCVQHC